MPQSYRMQRIADQMHQTLSQLLKTKVNDPRLQSLSLTDVEVSPDMGNATVYFSILDETQTKEVQKALSKASGFLRYELAHTLNLKTTPKLHFSFDDSLSRGNRLSHLINLGLKNNSKE